MKRSTQRWLNYQGAGLDYSDGGVVEREVLQFLAAQSPNWFYRSQIAYRLRCAADNRLENVLFRLLKRGDVQVKNENGVVLWRARV